MSKNEMIEQMENENLEKMRKLRIELMSDRIYTEDWEGLYKVMESLWEILQDKSQLPDVVDENGKCNEKEYDKQLGRSFKICHIINEILHSFFMDDDGFFLSEEACIIWHAMKVHGYVGD